MCAHISCQLRCINGNRNVRAGEYDHVSAWLRRQWQRAGDELHDELHTTWHLGSWRLTTVYRYVVVGFILLIIFCHCHCHWVWKSQALWHLYNRCQWMSTNATYVSEWCDVCQHTRRLLMHVYCWNNRRPVSEWWVTQRPTSAYFKSFLAMVIPNAFNLMYTDIDECVPVSECPSGATCTNVIGGYLCTGCSVSVSPHCDTCWWHIILTWSIMLLL